jgi:putative FmdB family regulatory protein
MPIYEYKCLACGEQFEITCKFSEREEKAVCPKCGANTVEPVFVSFSPIQPKM